VTNAINYQGGVVMLVAVLALVTGVVTGATESGVASDNHTNASIFLSDTVDDTTDLTTDTVGNVSTTVVGLLDVLAESDRLLARGVGTDTPDPTTDSAEPTSRPAIPPRPPASEQSAATTGDSTTGNRAGPVTSAGTTVEDRTLAAPATNRPGPGTGVAISLQVVAAGVALRKLAGLPAPTRTAVVTGRRLLDRLPRMVVPLRYSRYDDSDPLDHEDRVRVFDTVNESPGIYLTALSEQTDVTVSTLRHHVRVLEADGLVVRKRNGRTTHNRLAPEALEALEPLREADADPREAAASAD